MNAGKIGLDVPSWLSDVGLTKATLNVSRSQKIRRSRDLTDLEKRRVEAEVREFNFYNTGTCKYCCTSDECRNGEIQPHAAKRTDVAASLISDAEVPVTVRASTVKGSKRTFGLE